MIPEPLSPISYKNIKKTIRKYTTSRCENASFGKHGKPLAKHCFVATQNYTKIPYKTCWLLMILDSFSQFGHKKNNKTITKFTTSRCGIAPSGKHKKPLGKHGFAATQKCIKIPYKTWWLLMILEQLSPIGNKKDKKSIDFSLLREGVARCAENHIKPYGNYAFWTPRLPQCWHEHSRSAPNSWFT